MCFFKIDCVKRIKTPPVSCHFYNKLRDCAFDFCMDKYKQKNIGAIHTAPMNDVYQFQS